MEYAVPKKVETSFENDKIVRQTVTMYNIPDVELYTKACLSYGARIVDTFRNIVIVEYKKDSDGKIGIIS
jgi:hypothetical protein